MLFRSTIMHVCYVLEPVLDIGKAEVTWAGVTPVGSCEAVAPITGPWWSPRCWEACCRRGLDTELTPEGSRAEGGGSVSSERASRPSVWRVRCVRWRSSLHRGVGLGANLTLGSSHPDRVPGSMRVLRTLHCILKAKGSPRWIQRSGANGPVPLEGFRLVTV